MTRKPITPPRDLVPAVMRAAQVLDALASAHEPLGLADLTRRVDLPKSSVLGLCNTLVNDRLVTRHSDGRFSLGVRLVELAHAYLSSVDLTREFNTTWDAMNLLPQDGVVLAVLDGTDVIYVACRNGVMPLGVSYRIGLRLPANCTATGKALLGTLPEARVRDLYRGSKLQKLTPHSLGGIRTLLADLAQSRARGYAIDNEETREGMMCIGAPVFDSSGSPAVAAVAVSMLRYPEDPGKLKLVADAVTTFAHALSRRMGAMFDQD